MRFLPARDAQNHSSKGSSAFSETNYLTTKSVRSRLIQNPLFKKKPRHAAVSTRFLRKLSLTVSLSMVAAALAVPPAWATTESINCTTDAEVTGSFTVTTTTADGITTVEVTGNTSCAGEAVIPNTVTSIGYQAFEGANSLASVTFQAGSVLTSIADRAFFGASSLTSITIPATVTSIGDFAFYNATALTSVTFEAGSNLETIGNHAFRATTSLASIIIPASVNDIGANSFDGSSISSFDIPSGVVRIRQYAFANTPNLTSVTIPNTVTHLDQAAFQNSGLTSVTIPKSVTVIGVAAFQEASDLVSVSFEEDSELTRFLDQAFFKAHSLVSIDIPNGVVSLGNHVFHKAYALQSVTFPSSISYIGAAVFGYNTSMTSFSFPDDSPITDIKNHTFIGATALESIVIHSGVTSIGSQFASGATSLASVTFKGNAPSVGTDAFSNVATGALANVGSSATGYGSAGDTWNGLTIALTHSVTFDANGGAGAMTGQVAASSTALTTNTFTRDGFNFAGWNSAADGSGTGYAAGASYEFTSDETLYAQWTVSTYTVTFDANGGAGAMTGQVAASSTALTTNTFTRDGFNFAGWNSAADGSGTGYAAGASYEFTSDETLYAQWTAIPAPAPAPAPAPLETAAPTPTAPIETVQATAGSVEGSNETLEVASNEEGGSVVVKGEGWQLGVASKQKTGEALPANKDRRLIVQPETRVELAAEGLMPESAVAFWVFSEPTFAGEVQTDSTGKFEANMEMPDGLAPGDHTLQVLSRDSKGRVITLNFPIVVAEKVVQKVNALSFKGFVALFAKGYEGQRLSAKVGKDWVVVPSIAAAGGSNLFRRLESVGSGVDCSVRIYIDYALIDTINLTTK